MNNETRDGSSAPRIGPRMVELCGILRRMGGKADAQNHVYMELDYHGGSSNYYGHAVMLRAMRAGLIAVDREATEDATGNRVPVRLTDMGREVS